MFIQTPQGYFPTSVANHTDTLPAGYYTVMVDPQRGYFFAPIDPFTINHKIYGNSTQHKERILDTFFRRVGKNTAAAFEGLKGSGKSLLLKAICIDLVEQHEGVVITINTPFSDEGFRQLLQSVKQTKAVVFDEFEKVYRDADDRNGLLTLFDGTCTSHTMYLITTNNDRYSEAMEFFTNRPGRVYFKINFKDTDENMIREYCEDNLENKDRIRDVLSFVKGFRAFNMDMLSVLVSEMNQYPEESLQSLSEVLNIKQDITVTDLKVTSTLFVDGKDVTESFCQPESYHISRYLMENDSLNLYTDYNEDDVRDFDIYVTSSEGTLIQDPITRKFIHEFEKEGKQFRLEFDLVRPASSKINYNLF